MRVISWELLQSPGRLMWKICKQKLHFWGYQNIANGHREISAFITTYLHWLWLFLPQSKQMLMQMQLPFKCFVGHLHQRLCTHKNSTSLAVFHVIVHVFWHVHLFECEFGLWLLCHYWITQLYSHSSTCGFHRNRPFSRKQT